MSSATRTGAAALSAAAAAACGLAACASLVADSASAVRALAWAVDLEGGLNRHVGLGAFVEEAAGAPPAVMAWSSVDAGDALAGCAAAVGQAKTALALALLCTGAATYWQLSRAAAMGTSRAVSFAATLLSAVSLWATLSAFRDGCLVEPTSSTGLGYQLVELAAFFQSVGAVLHLMLCCTRAPQPALGNHLLPVTSVNAVPYQRKFAGARPPMRAHTGLARAPTFLRAESEPTTAAEPAPMAAADGPTPADAMAANAAAAAGDDDSLFALDEATGVYIRRTTGEKQAPADQDMGFSGGFKGASGKDIWAGNEGYDPTKEAGVTGPFGYFDPLGLAQVPLGRAVDIKERLKYFREAELKHGRVSMLAALGFLVAENFHPLWGGNIDVPSYVAYQQTPLQVFWPAVVAVIGAIETQTIAKYKNPGQGLWTLKEDAVPGDFGFDPLGLKPKTAEELRNMENKEINNGRLAMLAILGMVGQELAKGKKLLDFSTPAATEIYKIADPNLKVVDLARELADVLDKTSVPVEAVAGSLPDGF